MANYRVIIFIAFAWSLAAGKFVDELAYTYPVLLTTANFAKYIPSQKPAVVFYYMQSAQGRTDGQVLNMAIGNFKRENSTLNFYRIEGPYSPELISDASQIKSYPSLAFYPQGTDEIAEVYSGDWKVNALVKWLSNLSSTNTKSSTQKCGTIIGKYSELASEVKEQNENLKNIASIMKGKDKVVSRNWILELSALVLGTFAGFFIYSFIKRGNHARKMI